MARKQYFLTIDTETTQTNKVADFAAVISDRTGKIHAQCAVLVRGVYDMPTEHPLFFNPNASDKELWSSAGKDRRYAAYNKMLDEGTRMIASVSAINRWLEKANGSYRPTLTAYNLAFDVNKMNNTGIDTTMFDTRFCLWHAAATKWAHTKDYRDFIMSIHGFNPPTQLGNMTYKTNAEVMARFILDMWDLPDEPHTALEDIVGYELPILNALVRNNTLNAVIADAEAYNWRNYQVNDWFKAK